jgi:galactose mutarotase-like enzyme
MKIYNLENDFLRILISDAGAELQSIINKKTNLEYLWQAGAEWPKHAPVLFPFVGQLKNNSYYYINKEYHSNRHGFAREKIFHAEAEGNQKILFSLSDDEQTKLQYPFHFRLGIHYEILENTLIVSYSVNNTDKNNLLFSIGAHPAFKVPLRLNEQYDDYYLRFEKNETIERLLLTNGLISDQTIPFLNDSNILPLNKSMFYDDAIVLKNLQSELISLKNKKTNNGLHFIFKGYPYFGIWAAHDANFICLEPWHGIADRTDHNQNLKDKEGIISLPSGENFICSFSIIPF